MALVLHTTHGDLPVVLHFRECPTTAFNFLALCASGYYDGCTFYRHIPSVLLQTGDPTNTGKGGESIFAQLPTSSDAVDEAGSHTNVAEADGEHWRHAVGVPRRFFEDEGFGVTHHRRRGVLSMAHKGTKMDTNASQFFLLCAPQPLFDGVYTSFGEVDLDGWYDKESGSVQHEVSRDAEKPRSGEETLKALEEAAMPVNEKHLVMHADSVRINAVTILYNPFAEGRMRL